MGLPPLAICLEFHADTRVPSCRKKSRRSQRQIDTLGRSGPLLNRDAGHLGPARAINCVAASGPAQLDPSGNCCNVSAPWRHDPRCVGGCGLLCHLRMQGAASCLLVERSGHRAGIEASKETVSAIIYRRSDRATPPSWGPCLRSLANPHRGHPLARLATGQHKLAPVLLRRPRAHRSHVPQ